MSEPKMPVKCSVDNCQYWHDSMCHADEIQVDKMEDKKPKTSCETQCQTFRDGGSYGHAGTANWH